MSDAQVMQRESQAAEHTRQSPVYTPPVDIYETEQELVILADLPGVAAEDLAVKLEEATLTIEGEVGSLPEGDYLSREYRMGRYLRQFALGVEVDRDKIQATMKNGELRLVLPKAEAAKPRKITVQAA